MAGKTIFVLTSVPASSSLSIISSLRMKLKHSGLSTAKDLPVDM